MMALCLEINLQFLSKKIIIAMVINFTNDRMLIPDGRFAMKGN